MRAAVCINGQLRNWNHSRPHFDKWNKEIGKIEFDFFISTWDTIGFDEFALKPKDEISLDVTDEYIGDFDGLVDYEILDEDAINWFDFPVSVNENNTKMAYLFCKCNLLKTKYEHKNNFIYDFVISIRPDFVIKLTQLENRLISILTPTGDEWDKMFYELTPITKRVGFPHDSMHIGLWRHDIFSMGTSSTMDVYSNMFKYIYLNDDYNMIPIGHVMNHDYINYFALNEFCTNFHITKVRPSE
jgi:hypothetical protein